MSSGKVFLGLLAGVATGAALGILFAPDKGSSTRKKISNKRDAYRDELSLKFNDFVDGVTNKFDTWREEAMRLAEKGMAKAEAAGLELNTAANSKKHPQAG